MKLIRHLFISTLIVATVISGCKQQKTKMPVKNVGFKMLLDRYAAEYYALNPLSATRNGINDYNDQMEVGISKDYMGKMLAFNKRYLDSLSAVDTTRLSYSEQLSVDILRYKLSMEVEQLTAGYGVNRPVDQFVFSFPQNFALLGSGAGYIPFKSEKDYRNFISRMKSFPRWIDQSIENMQSGLEAHNTVPNASMIKVPPQLKPLYEGPTEQSVFYKPLLNLPDEMDSLAKANLVKDYTAAIDNFIKPSYQKLTVYLTNDYIPNTRSTTGLVDNSYGAAEYNFWLRYYTSTNMSADDIFNLGISEVARIRKEMDSVRVITGFKGDLKAFFEYMRTDPRFFPFKNQEEVLNRYRTFLARMEPSLKKEFNVRPKGKFEVRATEKFREAGANAQYTLGSRDGSRPGIFYETVRDPLKYNYSQMESLFMHEAIPGHHFQMGIQMEGDIPEFRKAYWTSAFGEGYAQYAESLGSELGMYTDPYQYMGKLNNEMERAVRLVLDAGMHAKGWDRNKAIAYMLENQPVSETIAIQRVERYMVTPGQPSSYKVGEQTILRLRREARQALGDKFDIRAFHDELLREGCMPLLILEKHMHRWMAR